MGRHRRIDDLPEFARRLNHAMEESRSEPWSVRELAKSAGYCYEQVRKVVTGNSVFSADLNDKLCALLNLDPAEMWRLAQIEKAEAKARDDANEPPKDVDVRKCIDLLFRVPQEELPQVKKYLELRARVTGSA